MISQVGKDVILEVRVRPNSRRFALARKGDQLVLEVTSPPKEGKANAEIVKELKKLFKKDVRIVKGLRGRGKVILVADAALYDVERLI